MKIIEYFSNFMWSITVSTDAISEFLFKSLEVLFKSLEVLFYSLEEK
jgi:hypothetical protein